MPMHHRAPYVCGAGDARLITGGLARAGSVVEINKRQINEPARDKWWRIVHGRVHSRPVYLFRRTRKGEKSEERERERENAGPLRPNTASAWLRRWTDTAMGIFSLYFFRDAPADPSIRSVSLICAASTGCSFDHNLEISSLQYCCKKISPVDYLIRGYNTHFYNNHLLSTIVIQSVISS